MLTIQNLENCFNEAKANEFKYVGIALTTPASTEVTIISTADFDSKLEYYKEAYSEDLKLNSKSEVFIAGFTHGNSFSTIEFDLASSPRKYVKNIRITFNTGESEDELSQKDADEFVDQILEGIKQLSDVFEHKVGKIPFTAKSVD